MMNHPIFFDNYDFDFKKGAKFQAKLKRSSKIGTDKLVGFEDIVHTNIYSWFVLLSQRTAWTIINYLGIMVRYINTTYTIALLNEDYFGVVDIMNIACDALFCIDFASAMLHWVFWAKNQGKLTAHSSRLSRLLWKNKALKPRPIILLSLDFISLLPLEYLRFFHLFRTWPHYILHGLPLIRIYRIAFIFGDHAFEFSLSSSVYQILIKFFVILILITHSMTCLWILIQDEGKKTSLFKASADKSGFMFYEPEEMYLVAFFFVHTTFTNIGFGDISPQIDTERLIGIFIAMIGFSMINGYLIGALSSVLMERARRLTNLQQRLTLIEAELEERKVPISVTKKIIRFYYALWVTRKGAGAKNKTLDELPSGLANQVYYDIFSPALNTSLLFRACGSPCQRALSRVMNINLYMAGDVILKRSEMNSKMFFIRKGTIQIMSYQDDETEIMTFGAGTIFGQCSLLLSLPAKSEVHAATFCEIHTLSRRNLFYTLINYPDSKEIIINAHRNLILNMMADKFVPVTYHKDVEPGNVLTTDSFYKTPLETSKLGRDDVCIITTFPYIFMPDTIFLRAWNILQGFLIVSICFFYPYCAAFTRTYPIESESIIILVDLAYWIDIYLSFFTAVNKENILLSTGRQIARERLSHVGIYLDIFAALPIHYFIPVQQRMKTVFLCNRCIKIYKIPLLFTKAEYNLNRSVIGLIRLIKYVLYFILGSYVMGMAYYMQACYMEVCDPTSWYANPPVTEYDGNPIFVSMYFAMMVISSTGYGEITVNNYRDIVWVISFYFPGVLLFCYLISEYSAHLSLAREPRINFIELAQRINSFLISNKMLPSERIRVRQYLNLQWEKNMGFEFMSGLDIFYDMPPHLLFQVNINSRCRGIQDMELFKGLGENVKNAILMSSFRRTLPPHEVVIYAGEVCSTLLILEEGYCEVTYGKDVSLKRIIGPGENIGTVELFLGAVLPIPRKYIDNKKVLHKFRHNNCSIHLHPISGSISYQLHCQDTGMTALCHVRTLTHCILVKVRKTDIRRALVLNPVAARELENAIHEFKQFPAVKEFRNVRPIRLHLAVRPSLQQSIFRFQYYQKQQGNRELREPYMKLGICKCIRYLLRNTTVLPYGKLLKRWELARCCFAFFSAIVFPPLPYLELEVPELFYIGWFLDIAAWIDLIHVCYYNQRNILVTHPLWTSGHYIKGSFALDFLFCFPFDRIMYRQVYDSNGETNASDMSTNILRLLRVGQVHRIPFTMMRLGQDFLSSPSIFLMILMQIIFTLVYLNLLTSLLVLFTVNYKVTGEGQYRITFSSIEIEMHMLKHLQQFEFSTKPTMVYLLNLYWVSITAFTIGFGDITATTAELMIFIIFVILISYLFFNYTTIILASYWSTINLNLTLYQKRLNHLIKFLRSENIEPFLKQHIINHFEYIWKKSRGMEGELVFGNFTMALKDDVMLHLYEETLRGVKAFEHMDPSFLRILSSRLKEAYFQTGATVYKRGDIISHIYIIHQGEVILVGGQEDQTSILWRSRIFGHLELGESSISQSSAVATKNLHLLTIPTIELYQLLETIHATIKSRDDDTAFSQNQFMTILSTRQSGPEEEDVEAKNIRREFLGSKRIWLIHTSHKISKVIHITYLITALLSVNLVTYHLAYQRHHEWIVGVSIPIELLYIVKIYMGFNTGFIDESGEFVTDLKIIRARYMRFTGFYIDFFTIIPFELLAFIGPEEHRTYIATALRITKLLRIYEIWKFFNSKSDTLNVNMVLVRLISMGVSAAILYHQCSCLWFMTICPLGDCTFSKTYQNTLEAMCEHQYLCSIYFVNSVLTTTGYGDIVPHTVGEIIFILIIAFLGRIYTATFIGQMVSTVEKSLYARTKYAFETETLKGYLIANDVSPQIRKTVLKYANDLWISEKGYQIPELLLHAPKYIISEIKLAAYGSHINDHPLFRDCHASFRKHLINKLKRTIYFAGNIIVHEGEVNGTAYFIHSGQVGYKTYSKDKGAQISVVNDSFGLAQGIHRKMPHAHTYFARSICVILTLAVEDWQYLIDFYAEDIVRLYNEVEMSK